MDVKAIKQAAAAYLPDMTRFLRDLIACDGDLVVSKDLQQRRGIGEDARRDDAQAAALILLWGKIPA